MTVAAVPPAFRARIAAHALMFGTFLKTPSIALVEILGGAGLDFVVIDEEHAPFDRAAIDTAIFAAHAMGMAALVRVRSAAPDALPAVLDCGADGLLVPHVRRADQAAAVVSACRYAGTRGYSGSVRSAGYGRTGMAETIAASDRSIAIIAQIEDADALDHLDAIAAVDGVDALFIGRGDLAVSLGAGSSDDAQVRDAAARIAAAASAAGKPVAVFSGAMAEAEWLHGLGATLFVHSSDQGFLRQASSSAVAALRTLGDGGPSR